MSSSGKKRQRYFVLDEEYLTIFKSKDVRVCVLSVFEYVCVWCMWLCVVYVCVCVHVCMCLRVREDEDVCGCERVRVCV